MTGSFCIVFLSTQCEIKKPQCGKKTTVDYVWYYVLSCLIEFDMSGIVIADNQDNQSHNHRKEIPP